MKTEVKTIEQLRGFEGHIKKLEDGTEQIVSDNGMNIVNGSGKHGEITQQDLQDLMDALATPLLDEPNRQWVVCTGFGGYMTIILHRSFEMFGRNKLPRKMKKLYFKSKKVRRRYLPQYYKNQIYYKY